MARNALLLRKFDPFQMPGELVRRLAVGRDATLREMLRVVDENLAAHVAPPQHLCIMAPRGAGKTFMFRLLGLELAERAAAGAKLHFLHLPEEMPHVLSPISFLREIRKHLRGEGPAANAPRKHDDPNEWGPLAADIDAVLSERFGAKDGLLVLCVENIRDVLREAFPDAPQQRSLRAWLERPGGRIMLIAASSAGRFDDENDKPLFAICRNVELAPWTTEQTLEFLDLVARARHGHGLRAGDEPVARAITIFTGGSPRMAVALAEVLGAGDALTAAQTLDGLIDNLQEYYLNRLRDMGAEAKRCLTSLLTEGENVSQTEVAGRLGMKQSDIAQIFRKLEKDQIVAGERLAGRKDKSYRVADRVFVHFYNVRVLHHGEERSVLAPILDFLVSAFTEPQRIEQAERLMAQGLRDDAQVLLGTLPVLDEVTIDYKWGGSIRGLLVWVADVISKRAVEVDEIVTALRQIALDRHSAPAVAEIYVRPQTGNVTPGLNDLVVGLSYLSNGQPTLARHWLSKLIDQGASPWLACLAYLARAYTEYLSENLDAQTDYSYRSREIARDIKDNELLAFSNTYTRYVSEVRGDWDQAERLAQEICDLEYPEDLSWWPAVGLRSLSKLADRRGDLQQATQYARRALEIAETAEHPAQIASAQKRLADCLLQDSQSEDALALAERAATFYRNEARWSDHAEAIDTACDALRGLGRGADAIERQCEAVAAADRHGGPYLRARAYATLAWVLSLPSVKPADIRREEVLDLADRALAILSDNPAFAWIESLALEAKLAVAGADRNEAARLEVARRLAPVARQAGRMEHFGWALAEAITALRNLKQYCECIDEAVAALGELVQTPGDVVDNMGFIATTLVQALKAEQRQGELRSIAADLSRRLDAASDSKKRSVLAGVFLGAAAESGDHAWGVELATGLLEACNGEAAAVGAARSFGPALACIAGAKAWERMAAHLDEAFWAEAAKQSAGWRIAAVLAKTEAASGRPDAYAVFLGAWNVLRGAEDGASGRSEILEQLLTSFEIRTLSAGLLTDIADTLAADAPGRFDAEARMLRDFARFNAAERDPDMLARLNPDVATALAAADPSLGAPKLAPPAKKRKPAAKRKPRARPRKGTS